MVTRTGKNLVDAPNATVINAYINVSSKITASAKNTLIYCNIKPNTNYTLSFTQVALSTAASADDYQLGLFASEPALNSVGERKVNQARSSATANQNFTYSFNSGNYTWVAVNIGNSDKTDISATLATVQLELGSTATTFEPYSGTSLTIDLNGTRYGAQLDVMRGTMTVDYVSESFTWGDLTVVEELTGYTRKRAILSANAASPYTTAQYCNMGKLLVNNTDLSPHFYCLTNIGAIVMPNNLASSATIQLVYPLATPLTVQLTPQQLSTLLGVNNIWSTTGDTAISYWTDQSLAEYLDNRFYTKAQIDALLEEIRQQLA